MCRTQIQARQRRHATPARPRRQTARVGPHRASRKGNGSDSKTKGEVVTNIIAARNFQSKIGYADLRANHSIPVRLWRDLKEQGYFYERKKKAWANLDKYGGALYPLASNDG